MSIPSSMPGASGTLDERRLRGALRLFLDAERADSAADRVHGSADPLSDLRRLAADLTREWQFSRIARHLSLGRVSIDARSLNRIPDGVSPRAILALIVHVGLDIDGERLEDAFGLDSQDVGLDLLQARLAFSDRSIPACREYGWIIGRYRDRGLAPDERVRLLSHATTCDVCRAALDRAQQADALLLAELDLQLDMLPERQTAARAGRSGRSYSGVALAAGSVVVLLAVVIGISMLGGLFSPPAEPVPLFASDAEAIAPLDGWLLQVSPVGFLEGVDLATGHKRGLDSGDGGGFSPLYRVSRTHIAAWRPSDGQRDDVLTIGPIGQQVAFRLTWNRQFDFWYPSGWLDDDTLLIVKSPEHISGETEQHYLERVSTESRLVAFDATTGAERVLMTGGVAAAFPSPDGTMLAILHPIDRRWPGNTIELRPLAGETIGEAVVRIDHRVVADGVWLADSSRYVTSVITDESVTRGESTRGATLAEHGVQGVALVGIARDGAQLTLATAYLPETIVPIAASPDGASLVYQVRADQTDPAFPGVPNYAWRCFRMPTSGGDPVLLANGESPARIFKPAWSPDGATMVLPVARAFLLSTDGRLDQPLNPNATTLLVFGPGWRPGIDPQAIYSSGRDLYGWLPPGSLERLSGSTSGVGRSLASVATPEQEIDDLAISARSAAADGSYITVTERGSGRSLIWDIYGNRQRRLANGISEQSWFNQGTATIGIASEKDGVAGSRIVVNAADISSSVAYLDHRYFDPVNLGNVPDRHYALPMVSPTGTVVSFFVVDSGVGRVTLWLDDSSGPARSIAEWSVPVEPAIEPTIVAAWVRSDTLLIALPDDWHEGMPRSVVLSRVVIEPGATVQVDELVRLDTSRSSAGVALVEFALNPDATQLAYRLRHYARASDDSAADDTLHIAGTDDLGRAIEIERGGSGAGLMWTPSGDELAAGVRGRIALYSSDGRDREYLSPRGIQSSFPILIGETIWFEAVDNRGGSIQQIDLD